MLLSSELLESGVESESSGVLGSSLQGALAGSALLSAGLEPEDEAEVSESGDTLPGAGAQASAAESASLVASWVFAAGSMPPQALRARTRGRARHRLRGNVYEDTDKSCMAVSSCIEGGLGIPSVASICDCASGCNRL